MKMLKKTIMFLLIIGYLIFLTCCETNQKELRLRILANSNEKSDQIIKLDVKEKVRSYLEKGDLTSLNLNDLNDYLQNNYPNLVIKVTKEKVNYEAKAYHNKVIPGGRYETILITIGKGEGKNFWTLLYPEFFNISFEDDHEISYHSYFYDLFNQ